MDPHHRRLAQFSHLVGSGETAKVTGPLRLGIDLGTGNIVLAVADLHGQPVAGAWRSSTVVRDGIVVDWLGAVRTVQQLLAELQAKLNHEFNSAAIAVPPGIDKATARIFSNVVEACQLSVAEIVDEPVAAARALGIRSGAVIDVGHGTTGVSILADGNCVVSDDEPTGGHHMTLVLSGALGLDYATAETLKKDPAESKLVFGLIRPTMEKMASIAKRILAGREVDQVFLVGGATSFPESTRVFSAVLGRPVEAPAHPLFPTPLGTALKGQP